MYNIDRDLSYNSNLIVSYDIRDILIYVHVVSNLILFLRIDKRYFRTKDNVLLLGTTIFELQTQCTCYKLTIQNHCKPVNEIIVIKAVNGLIVFINKNYIHIPTAPNNCQWRLY